MTLDTTRSELLLVHVPAIAGDRCFAMQMAVGLIPIAESVRSAGHAVQIVHLGLERFRDPHFSLAELARAVGARLVGFSVQWHWQLAPTLEEAQTLGLACPDVKIVLGGLTASYFAEEVIRSCPFVHFVIRGDAEVPLVELAQKMDHPDAWETIPNLVWRAGGNPQASRRSYVASSQALCSFSHGTSEAVRQWELAVVTGVEDNLQTPSFLAEPAVTLCGGRGCVHTCSFCSGSSRSMLVSTGRRKPAWLDSGTLYRTIAGCRERGVSHFYLSADVSLREIEYLALLDRLRLGNVPIRLDVEAWTLPSKGFLAAFRRAVHPDSCLILSPTCGSEAVRKANRSCFFTNEQYEERLRVANDLRLNVWLYFTIGLPFETREDVSLTRSWQKHLSERFACVIRTETQPQQVEPGSPMFLDPARYEIELLRRSYEDFILATPLSGVGYNTRHFSSSEIEGMFGEMI